MLKKNKGLLIVSSIIILLPILAGLIFYDRLPDSLNMHWNLQGEVDGQGNKPLMIFLLPCILLAVHWLCLLITAWDWKKRPQGRKVEKLIFWLMPITSLFASGVMYGAALGHGARMMAWSLPLVCKLALPTAVKPTIT